LNCFQKRIPDPSNELPVGSKTNFKAEVTKIKWDNLFGENKNKVAVECSDGSVYVADHVIVTMSLGVLKERGKSMFQPALPAQKLNAIKVSHKVLEMFGVFSNFIMSCGYFIVGLLNSKQYKVEMYKNFCSKFRKCLLHESSPYSLFL
jgi:hypothetical protein